MRMWNFYCFISLVMLSVFFFPGIDWIKDRREVFVCRAVGNGVKDGYTEPFHTATSGLWQCSLSKVSMWDTWILEQMSVTTFRMFYYMLLMAHNIFKIFPNYKIRNIIPLITHCICFPHICLKESSALLGQTFQCLIVPVSVIQIWPFPFSRVDFQPTCVN